jgi:hypothetical protein
LQPWDLLSGAPVVLAATLAGATVSETSRDPGAQLAVTAEGSFTARNSATV